MNEYYVTKDIGEATVLLCKGFELVKFEWKNEICYFYFPNKIEAEKITHQYNFGSVEVSAKQFYQNMILIKRKILPLHNPRRYNRKDKYFKGQKQYAVHD